MAKFRIGGKRRRYGRKGGRGAFIARRYAASHRRLLRRAYAGKRRRRYKLKYNAPRIGIPNKVSVKLRHFAPLVLPATGGPWDEWRVGIEGQQLLSTLNLSTGLFNNANNNYPLGFATYVRMFNYYRVNALKIKFQLAHKLTSDIHIFGKWVNNQTYGEFCDMDYCDMMVHRGITHRVIKAWTDQKNGETQERYSYNQSKNVTFYAHHSAVLPFVGTKSGQLDKYADITSSTYDPTTHHYLYVIGDGPVAKVTDTTNLPLDADAKWFLVLRIMANEPARIVAATTPPFIAGEKKIVLRVKSKWFITFWRLRAVDDQEVDHTSNDMSVCETGVQEIETYVA